MIMQPTFLIKGVDYPDPEDMASIRDIDESDACMRQRLVNSLSQSFPGSALSKALQCMDSDDEELKDPLSSSCFAEMRLEKGELDDDELTSLSWLQETDLLKSLSVDEQGEDGQKENEAFPKVEGGLLPQTHPPHIPYNPQKHINSKPPYSFSCLIFMAVEDSPMKRLPVKDIYNWILSHFPYFQNAPTGWKNSVRHNLSLNKCFKKVDKEKGQTIGKGSLWCIDPDYRPNLLQALRKTPYHPYHQLQMMSAPTTVSFTGLPGYGINRPLPLTTRPAPNTISPHLFPFLSKRLGLAGSNAGIDREIQDVAQTLVSMKGLSSKNSSGHSSDGSDYSSPPSPTDATHRLKQHCRKATASYFRKINSGKPIVCTLTPSEDHTYSASTLLMEEYTPSSPNSSIDDEYDFGAGGNDSDISSNYHSDFDYGSDDVCDEVDGDVQVVPKPPKIPAKVTPRKSPRKLQAASPPMKSSTRKRKRKPSVHIDDEEEQKKIEEGADALMNLAGIFVHRQREATPRQTRSSSKRRNNEI